MNQNQRKKYKRKQDNNSNEAKSEVTIKNSNPTNEQSYRKKVQVQSFDDMEFEPKQKQYNFVYKFTQYVRLTLIKILPPKQKSIKINKQSGTIRGPQFQCEKLIQSIKEELQISTMKIIAVPRSQDIDQIEFHLSSQYQVKVYRIKYVALAANDVAKNYNFSVEAENLIRQLKQKSKILIRILKKYADKCVQDINQIIGRSNKEQSMRDNFSRYERSNAINDETHLTTTIIKSSSNSSNISETEQEQTSFYKQKEQMKKSNAKEPEEKQLQKKKKGGSVVNLLQTMPQPTQDDSISVVAGKKNNKYRQKKQPQMMKKNKVESQNPKPTFQKIQVVKNRVQLLKYEFQESDFNMQSFKKWLRQKKQIENHQVEIKENKDPYDDKLIRYVIKLAVLDDTPMHERHEKIQAFEIFFKFKKVIFIKLKNELYKKQLIQEQESLSDNALTIKYVKGYKSPKWHENIMWRHIISKDYSDQKKSANTDYFEAFFLEGLKDLVNLQEQEIKNKIKNEPLDDIVEDIMYKVDEKVANQIRDSQRIKSFLKKHVELIVKQFFSHCCRVKQISFIISALKISLFVKPQQHMHFMNTTKNEILEKLKKQLVVHTHTTNFIIDEFTYQKLKKEIIIVQQSDKEFSFVTTNLLLSSNFNSINHILNSVNKINEIEIVIKDILTSKKISDKINELKNKEQFAEIKFNKSIQKNNHIFKFYGRGYILDSIKQTLKNYQEQLASNIVNYHQIFNLKEKQVLNDQQFIEDIHQKHKIFINASETHIDCKIIIVSNEETFKKKTISIKSTTSLDFAPLQSVIVFRNVQELEKFNSCWTRTFKTYIKKQGITNIFQQKNRNYTLMIKSNPLGFNLLKDILDSNESRNSVVMVMPEQDKKAYMLEMASLLSEQKKYKNRQINILLLQLENNIVFSKLLGIQQFSKQKKHKKQVQKNIVKYYVSDQKNKYYYSQNGNNKILAALNRNEQSVILNNQDLNITHTSHKFIRQSSSICHLQSATVVPVQIVNGKVIFTLKNKIYEMPAAQSILVHQCINLNMAQIDLSLGVYQIKFSTMEQINLFSGYVRKLQKQETIIKPNRVIQNLQVHYDVKVGLLTYQYPNQIQTIEALPKVIKQVQRFLDENIKIKQFSLNHIPHLSEQDINNLKEEIQEEQSIICSYNIKNKELSINSLDQNDFLKIEWKIRLLQSKLSNINLKEPIKYPAFWSNQIQDIQEFDVASNSDEFKKVQDLFKVGQIKELKRIQNKIIYKKYYQEGQFLKSLNGGTPVKTMQLFHGTRMTNPEEIYKDKEESFNINYSSDSNLLGRGIYFAEKSEYSNSYRYTQNVSGVNKVLGLFKGNVTTCYSMFLCQVYVGQSQKCPAHNGAIKDTSYRDNIKKIRYQSMTDFLVNSNIFVVYKSRRAYPLYLIKY